MNAPWEPDPELRAALEHEFGPQPTNPGEGLLHLLKANPTLLDPAPADREQWGQAITRRGEDEVHSCLRCGNRAQMAIIAETPDRPRWLDLCHECLYWLRQQLDEAEWRSW